MIGGKERFAEEFAVSRETLDRLECFVTLIQKWSSKINLISRHDLLDPWERHVSDSAQLIPLARPAPGTWVDLGSGGGFPAIVIAVLSAEKSPQTDMVMIEADARKATFLKTAVRELGLRASVITDRIEEAPPQSGDVVTARALAPLDQLLPLALRHLAPSGYCLFPKGIGASSEIRKALESYRFACDEVPRRTQNGSVVLRISEISRG